MQYSESIVKTLVNCLSANCAPPTIDNRQSTNSNLAVNHFQRSSRSITTDRATGGVVENARERLRHLAQTWQVSRHVETRDEKPKI